MKEYPKVSVVTPSYNSAEYIEQTILSVLSQNYPNLEHLVMDGGSKDGTRAILEKYPHLTWVSEPDKGQSDALNKGFKKADGAYIGWLNADDLYEPGMLHEAVQYLEDHPEIDMLYTDLHIIDEQGERIGFTAGKPFDIMELLVSNPVKQPTLLMRQRVMQTLGGLDEKYHYVMDREFWLRMGLKGFRVVYLPGKTFASFRLCQGTKTFEHTPRFREEWIAIIEKAYANEPWFKEIPQQAKQAALNKNYAALSLALMNEAYNNRSRLKGLKHAMGAWKADPSLAANRGFWNQMISGFLGVDYDRTKKFRKAI